MASQKRSAIAEKNRLSDAMRDFEDHMVRARALFEGGLGFAKFVDRLPGGTFWLHNAFPWHAAERERYHPQIPVTTGHPAAIPPA
jgi:hypothetical protein